MKPTKVTRGGEVKIVDSKMFPVTANLGSHRYAQARRLARIALASQCR
jgi:hypothetical protein